MRAPLLAATVILVACGSDNKIPHKTLPDGFLVENQDLGATAPPADLAAGLSRVDLYGVDLAGVPAADLAQPAAAADGSTAGGTTPDTCASAVDLVSGIELTDQDTTGLADDYHFGTTCSAECDPELGGVSYAGPDAAYRISVPAGKTLTVTVTPSQLPTAWDPAVAIVGDCGISGPTCLAGHEGLLNSEAETASWTNAGAAAKTVYVIVDSALASFQSAGKFRILASVN